MIDKTIPVLEFFKYLCSNSAAHFTLSKYVRAAASIIFGHTQRENDFLLLIYIDNAFHNKHFINGKLIESGTLESFM